MTETQFKKTKFGFGDHVKIGKKEYLIYEIDFEHCLFGVFDESVPNKYIKNYHCIACKHIPKP